MLGYPGLWLGGVVLLAFVGLQLSIRAPFLLDASSSEYQIVKTQQEEEEDVVVQHVKRPDGTYCEDPPAPRNAMHVVVGAYSYNETEGEVSFDSDNNYIWDFGLTNTPIFWYRKERPDKPPRTRYGPCNTTMQEVVFLPNTGQESVALVNHIISVWDDDPPKAIVFLHGHLARAYHATCEDTFARIIAYYRMILQQEGNATATLPMVTLTAKNNFLNHFVKRRRRRRLAVVVPMNITDEKQEPCPEDIEPGGRFRVWMDEMMVKYKMLHDPFEHGVHPTKRSACCTNSIIPWDRISKYPKEFYMDWLTLLTDTSYNDYCKSRTAFEYVLWQFFGDYNLNSKGVMAISVGGLRRYVNDVASPLWEEDPTLQERAKRCMSIQSKFGLRTTIEWPPSNNTTTTRQNDTHSSHQ